MIHTVQNWFSSHADTLQRMGIKYIVSEGTSGLLKNSIYVELKFANFESTVQVWETGESDIILADIKTHEASVKHFEFSSEEDLSKALDDLIRKMQDI